MVVKLEPAPRHDTIDVVTGSTAVENVAPGLTYSYLMMYAKDKFVQEFVIKGTLLR